MPARNACWQSMAGGQNDNAKFKIKTFLNFDLSF
jgi:hypothetical protein